MASSITQSQAVLHRLLAERNGADVLASMSGIMRDAVEVEAASLGVPPADLVAATAAGGDARDRRIAELEARVHAASDMLVAWLTDRTEEGFEEEAEIDDIRSLLEEALD